MATPPRDVMAAAAAAALSAAKSEPQFSRVESIDSKIGTQLSLECGF